MGGQKTIGTIFSEAVKQLKENYFQHVGASGILMSASLLFSSVLYFFFWIFYFIIVFGMMIPAMTLPFAGMAAAEGHGAAAAVTSIGTVLLMLFITMVFLFIFAVVMLLVMIATNTVQAGVQKAVLLLVQGDKLTWQAVWGNFKFNWKRYLGVSAWTMLWTTLWSLLFVIPGIIKSFSYILAPYLVIEYPDMPVRQALKKSIDITQGHRGKLFLIWLIQYGFLMAAGVVASFGLVFAQYAAMIVWVFPLFYAMLTIAYLDIKRAAVEKGLLPAHDSPTV